MRMIVLLQLSLCTFVINLKTTDTVFGEKVKARNVHGKLSEPKQNFNNEAQKPKTNVQEECSKHEPSQLNSSSDITEEITTSRYNDTAEHTKRKILFEWYDYGYSMKELLNLIDEGAKTCGCAPMRKPILNAGKRINQALNSVSNKLRYGSDSKAEKYE